MKDKSHLTPEELALLASLESGEWQSVPDLSDAVANARKMAQNTLKKDARVNIRISSLDLLRLKQKAAHMGLPYQTFIASILHQYAQGYLHSDD